MATEDLKLHIEELINILGEKITVEELERELKRFLEYGVPIEQAKKTLLKKHGISSHQDRTLVMDLRPNERNVHILTEVYQSIKNKLLLEVKLVIYIMVY